MPLDHYVSQVHLKNFYSPKLGQLMYCIRKRDMKAFPCRSEDVCRIQDGNTNKYLKDERAIEEFLKGIEPNYNGAIERLRSGKIDKDAVFVVAGFVAYVVTCSPAAMRLNVAPIQNALKATAELLDKKGILSPSPASFDDKTITELFDEGRLEFKVDEKYPQAIGIEDIQRRVEAFANSKWDVIINEAPEHPFFTSDFPVAIERTSDLSISNRVVPLAPNLAVRIMPRRDRSSYKAFSGIEFEMMKLKKYGVLTINRLIVQSAENLVFYRDEADWVKGFVEKHSRFLIEPTVEKVKTEHGYIIAVGQKLIETPDQKNEQKS